MSHSVLNRIILAFSMALCAASAIAAEPGDAPKASSPNQAAEASKNDQPLPAAEVYKAQRAGIKAYREGKYAEAYPNLLIAAKRGFEATQAQLGYIYLEGLGNTKKDVLKAIAWLGVAADDETDPEIAKFFQNLWNKIPEDKKAMHQKNIDIYIANYGAKANGLQCSRSNKKGSKIRTATCLLTDANGRPISDEIDDAMRDLPGEPVTTSAPSMGGAGGGGEPSGPRPGR